MSEQQSCFDFEGGSASQEEYNKWLAGRQLAVRELAMRLGLPLGHEVEVWLIGGMAGAVGGMFVAKVVGWVLDATGKNYLVPFLMAGFAYLIALGVIHMLLPKLESMRIQEDKI